MIARRRNEAVEVHGKFQPAILHANRGHEPATAPPHPEGRFTGSFHEFRTCAHGPMNRGMLHLTRSRFARFAGPPSPPQSGGEVLRGRPHRLTSCSISAPPACVSIRPRKGHVVADGRSHHRAVAEVPPLLGERVGVREDRDGGSRSSVAATYSRFMGSLPRGEGGTLAAGSCGRAACRFGGSSTLVSIPHLLAQGYRRCSRRRTLPRGR